jgi:hypothetical protein
VTLALALAALPFGGALWSVSAWQARTMGSRSGNLGWWVGVAVALVAVLIVAFAPLGLPPALALPLVVALGVTVVTDLLDFCVYDVISLSLVGYALALAAVHGTVLMAIAAALLYGGLGLTVLLATSVRTMGLADVYGLSFLGALFGWGAWIDVVAALLATSVLMVVTIAVMRRSVPRVALFPGIAVAALLGLSPVVPGFEAFCASLV